MEEKGMIFHYFGAKARGFPVLVGAAYWGKNVHWEKYSMDDWKNDKNNIHSKATFNQLPVLQDGDFFLAQSNAIVRYCGRKWGKDGNTNKEYALSEALIEESADIYNLMSGAKYKHGNTPDSWSDCYKSLDRHLVNLEKLMNGSKFGCSLTMGDMSLFSVLNMAIDSFPNLLGHYLQLKSWYDGIAGNDAVAKLLKDSVRYLKQPEPMTLIYFGLAARCFDVIAAAAYLWRSDLHWEKISFSKWSSNADDIKSKPHFGQMPFLEDGGKRMSQSMAIARYVAQKWDLEGCNMEDYAMSEQLIEQSNDIFSSLTKAKYKKDTKVWAKALSDMPAKLTVLEKFCDGGKFTSKKTMGDFCVFKAIHFYLQSVWDGLKAFPNLATWYSEISSHKAVQRLVNMPTYYQHSEVEFHYFGLKGRSFSVPIAAAFLGKKEPAFKWVKYTGKAWAANDNGVKDHCRFGQLPMLKHNTRSLVQSMAIVRYVAKIWGLEGNSAKEYAICEQLIEQSNELITLFGTAKYGQPKPDSAQQWDEQLAKVPKELEKVERIMHCNKFTEHLTMGDFTLFKSINYYLDSVPNGLDNFKALNVWYNNILSNEEVAALLKSTPAYFKKPAS